MAATVRFAHAAIAAGVVPHSEDPWSKLEDWLARAAGIEHAVLDEVLPDEWDELAEMIPQLIALDRLRDTLRARHRAPLTVRIAVNGTMRRVSVDPRKGLPGFRGRAS